MTLIEDNLEYRIGGLDDPDFFCKEDPKSHRFIQFEKAKELTNIEKKIPNMLLY